MDLKDRVKSLLNDIDSFKVRFNRYMLLMSIINYLVEGRFRERKVYEIMGYYYVNDNEFMADIIVELIERYHLKNNINESELLNKFHHLVDTFRHVATSMGDVNAKVVNDYEFVNEGIDKGFCLKNDDFKEIVLFVSKVEYIDGVINNDILLFLRDNWRLIENIKGPDIRRYYNEFADKHMKKKLNSRQFIKQLRMFIGDPTTKWFDNSSQKVYNIPDGMKDDCRKREEQLKSSLLNGVSDEWI